MALLVDCSGRFPGDDHVGGASCFDLVGQTGKELVSGTLIFIGPRQQQSLRPFGNFVVPLETPSDSGVTFPSHLAKLRRGLRRGGRSQRKRRGPVQVFTYGHCGHWAALRLLIALTVARWPLR